MVSVKEGLLREIKEKTNQIRRIKNSIKILKELVKECDAHINPMDVGITAKELKEAITILDKK